MELRHFRYFLAVAEELSFRRAADRLRLAQPSLGRQIRALEEEMGEQLFDRTPRGVVLTNAGRVLVDEARAVLARVEAAVVATQAAVRGLGGRLRIATIGPLSASFLPGTVATFRERYPGVEIDIMEMGPDEQLAALAEGRIEIAFQPGTRGSMEMTKFPKRAVLSCGISVAVPARHTLAAARMVKWKDLAGERLLNLRPRHGSGYERWLRTSCKELGGFTAQFRSPAAEHWDAMLGLVAAGEGLAVLPDIVVRSAHASHGWSVKPLGAPKVQFELCAVWNPANPSVVLSNYLAVLGELKIKAARE